MNQTAQHQTLNAQTKNPGLIREARTKPVSPDRSLILLNQSQNTSQQRKQKNSYVQSKANVKEESMVLNMISNLSKKNERESTQFKSL